MMVKVWAFRLASVLLPLVPRRLGCRLACLMGILAYYLADGPRRNVQDNIEKVLGEGAPPAKVRLLARGVFCNVAKNYFDLFRLPKLDLASFGKLVQTDGFEHFENALNEGRGVIVVTAHVGNFDVTGQEIAARGLDLTILVEPLQPPEVFEIVSGLRMSKGVQWVPVGPSALKQVVKALKRGGAVGIACDRDIQKNGLKVPFFGQMATLPQGAAYLALRTGAKIVPAFGERLPDDRFAIHIEPPLEVVRTGNFEADVLSNVERITAVLEKYIGARADQWVVFESIWPGSKAEQSLG